MQLHALNAAWCEWPAKRSGSHYYWVKRPKRRETETVCGSGNRYEYATKRNIPDTPIEDRSPEVHSSGYPQIE